MSIITEYIAKNRLPWDWYIDMAAELAHTEIQEMADQALLDLGFSTQFINRSRAQKRRYQRRQA